MSEAKDGRLTQGVLDLGEGFEPIPISRRDLDQPFQLPSESEISRVLGVVRAVDHLTGRETLEELLSPPTQEKPARFRRR